MLIPNAWEVVGTQPAALGLHRAQLQLRATVRHPESSAWNLSPFEVQENRDNRRTGLSQAPGFIPVPRAKLPAQGHQPRATGEPNTKSLRLFPAGRGCP